MGTYSDWFKRKVILDRDLQSHTSQEEMRSRVHKYLTCQRFRSIQEHGGTIAAVRGRKFLTLVNVGDPRRHFHSIAIVIRDNVVSIHLDIRSWFSLGTRHDTAVFLAELTMLDGLLQSGSLDQTPLAKAQSKRRKADFRTLWTLILLAVGVGTLVGIGIVATIILTSWAR